MLNGQPISITAAQYNDLVNLQNAEDYTEFYRYMSDLGSDIATLYASGPTGFGNFGQYSHQFTIDQIGETEFRAIQQDISERISEAILNNITDSHDGLGTYFIPSPQEFVQVEIDAWPTITLSDGVTPLPVESYAGWDLLDAADVFGSGGAGADGNSIFGAFGTLQLAFQASDVSFSTLANRVQLSAISRVLLPLGVTKETLAALAGFRDKPLRGYSWCY